MRISDDLKPKERKILENDTWSISCICLWEIFKLNKLGRIELDTDHPDFVIILSQLNIWPLDILIYKALDSLDFKNDPANEIIAATSIAYNVPLLTRDKKILKSKKVPFAM